MTLQPSPCHSSRSHTRYTYTSHAYSTPFPPYLVPVAACVDPEGDEAGAPVLQHVRLCVLEALPVVEAPLCARGGDHVHPTKIHLQVFPRVGRYLAPGAPRTALLLHPHSAEGREGRG